MDSYFDIQLMPDPEFKAAVLMNAVYTKLHKVLYDSQSSNIAVSFPKYEQTMGDVLRLHSTAEVLDGLQHLAWVGGMSGYCQQGMIQPVPVEVKFRTVFRRQQSKSLSKLRRQERRGNLTEAQIQNYITKMNEGDRKLKLPYLELTSRSNGHRHRRYIQLGTLVDEPIVGDFDLFGLSKTATVPWF